jgi:hypothetical protein
VEEGAKQGEMHDAVILIIQEPFLELGVMVFIRTPAVCAFSKKTVQKIL